MDSLHKYGVSLLPVVEDDAQFIIDMRTDSKKSRFISATNSDVHLQKQWIKAYKEREAANKEYYFIAMDNIGEKFASYRVYDITDENVVIGSWVTKPGYTNALNSIKVDIIVKEFVFENLNYPKLKFDVRKKNNSVLKYHRLFNPKIIGETADDFFFELDKDSFFENRQKFFKNIK